MSVHFFVPNKCFRLRRVLKGIFGRVCACNPPTKEGAEQIEMSIKSHARRTLEVEMQHKIVQTGNK